MDYFGVEEEIKKMTPEECVQSNLLKDLFGSSFSTIL